MFESEGNTIWETASLLAREMELDSAIIHNLNKDNSFLNHKNESPAGYGYAVFGRVVEGMSIVNKIKGVRTKNVGGMGNVPETPIEIKSVKKL